MMCGRKPWRVRPRAICTKLFTAPPQPEQVPAETGDRSSVGHTDASQCKQRRVVEVHSPPECCPGEVARIFCELLNARIVACPRIRHDLDRGAEHLREFVPGFSKLEESLSWRNL